MFIFNLCPATPVVAFVIASLLALVACDRNNDIVGPSPDPDPAVEPAISVSLSESSIELAQGENDTLTVTITRTGGFSGAVALSLDDVPDGVTAIFDPSSIPAGESESTLILEAAAEAPAGESELVVQVQGEGVGNATVALGLLIEEAGVAAEGDYSITLDPSSLSVNPGETGVVRVSVDRHCSLVTLAVTDLPPGVTIDDRFLASFERACQRTQGHGAAADLQFHVGVDVEPWTYAPVVIGQASGMEDRSAPLELVVTPHYTLSANPSTVVVQRESSATVQIELTRLGFTDEVALLVTGMPDGVDATVSPVSVTRDDASVMLDVAMDVEPGNYNLTVTGQADGLEDRAVTFELRVFDFTLSAEPQELTVTAGASDSTTITVTLMNACFGVDLSVDGAPAGVTASLDPSGIFLRCRGFTESETSRLTLELDDNVASGTHTLTVTGIPDPNSLQNGYCDDSACESRTVTIELIVP